MRFTPPVRHLRIAGLAAAVASFAAPIPVAAHELSQRYESPLPLEAYLGGAAFAVAMSFALVLGRERTTQARDRRPAAEPESGNGRERTVPAPLRLGLRAVGLLAWLWIAVQGITATGLGDPDAASLFLWVYGWVGVALISAFVGPAWQWLNPFATLYDIGAAVLRRVGIRGSEQVEYPAALGAWPAVATFCLFIWLELAIPGGRDGRLLILSMLAYTAWTLAMMNQFGRDTWLRRGETFSAWFGILGRLAPIALVDGTDDRVRIHRFASRLREPGWTTAMLALVALGAGSVIYDGLSQTEPFFEVFGSPGAIGDSAILAGFLFLIVLAAIGTSRLVGVPALCAGLVPIAAGYIVAHYLTYLLFDGQRIVAVLNDPLANGASLLGLTAFEPAQDWLPPVVGWAIQLGAIVGGHVIGAVAGHRVALDEATEAPVERRRRRTERDARTLTARRVRLRQIPLALLMIGLTTLTLWSLGQNVVVRIGDAAALPHVEVVPKST